MPRRLVLAGCGGMGRRHLRGYRVLQDFEPGRLELAAVVDPEPERASFVAKEAGDLLGLRPTVYRSLEAAVADTPDLELIDVVAPTAAHLPLVETATSAGLHVLCEKPMAPTIRACRAMQVSAERNGRLLSIAENYRRDPIARLMRALISASAIGEVRSVLDFLMSGGRSAQAGGWKYQRDHGGPLLGMGVHNADLQLYMVGSIERIYGQVRLREIADAPDVLMATLEYEGGAIGQWICDRAAQGPGLHQFSVVGSNGQIDLPGVRSGRPLRVHTGTDPDPIGDDDVLAMVPAFNLDDRTARFFGGDRLARYDDDGAGVGGEADLKLIAIEMAELLDAIDTGGALEVDAETGLAAVGLVMAVHESSDAGRPVAMAEVLDGSLSEYQGEADRALGLCG